MEGRREEEKEVGNLSMLADSNRFEELFDKISRKSVTIIIIIISFLFLFIFAFSLHQRGSTRSYVFSVLKFFNPRIFGYLE